MFFFKKILKKFFFNKKINMKNIQDFINEHTTVESATMLNEAIDYTTEVYCAINNVIVTPSVMKLIEKEMLTRGKYDILDWFTLIKEIWGFATEDPKYVSDEKQYMGAAAVYKAMLKFSNRKTIELLKDLRIEDVKEVSNTFKLYFGPLADFIKRVLA